MSPISKKRKKNSTRRRGHRHDAGPTGRPVPRGRPGTARRHGEHRRIGGQGADRDHVQRRGGERGEQGSRHRRGMEADYDGDWTNHLHLLP